MELNDFGENRYRNIINQNSNATDHFQEAICPQNTWFKKLPVKSDLSYSKKILQLPKICRCVTGWYLAICKWNKSVVPSKSMYCPKLIVLWILTNSREVYPNASKYIIVFQVDLVSESRLMKLLTLKFTRRRECSGITKPLDEWMKNIIRLALAGIKIYHDAWSLKKYLHRHRKTDHWGKKSKKQVLYIGNVVWDKGSIPNGRGVWKADWKYLQEFKTHIYLDEINIPLENCSKENAHKNDMQNMIHWFIVCNSKILKTD